jgi:hypothetical protein
VIEEIRHVAGTFDPLRIELSGPATFAPVTPVAYLPVGGDSDQLLDLRSQLLFGPLERPDRYPYVPHVTVADDGPTERLEAMVTTLGRYEAEMMIHGVHVLRQHDDRVWRPLADAPFSAPAVIARGGLPLELITSELPFQNRQSWCIAARRQGVVVGQATGRVRGTTCVIDSFWVDVQGEGVGSHLAAAVESLAAGRGCEEMTVMVEDDTDGFWRQRGWGRGPMSMRGIVR